MPSGFHNVVTNCFLCNYRSSICLFFSCGLVRQSIFSRFLESFFSPDFAKHSKFRMRRPISPAAWISSAVMLSHSEDYQFFIRLIATSTASLSWFGVWSIELCDFGISPRTDASVWLRGLYKSQKCFNHLFWTSFCSVNVISILSLITLTLDACFP